MSTASSSLRVLTADEATAEANRHDGNARVRLLEIVSSQGVRGGLAIKTFEAEEEGAFLEIAWQEIDETRHLTPDQEPRTLGAVADRIRMEFGSFQMIVESAARPGLTPEWFEPCARIEREGFDRKKWIRPWLVPAVSSERRGSPSTSLYVWEGVHSTIVLALGLTNGSIEWSPTEAVVSRERPK